MTEIDILKRSSFLWCDLRGDDQYFIATGFEAWGGVFYRDGEWYAVGGRKNNAVKLLAAGERIVCFAAADDWINLFETDSAAHKTKNWLHQPATEKQLRHLPPEYRNDYSLTRYKASALMTMSFNNTPKDEGFSGQTLRIFAAGHVFEDLAIRWLRLAGFELFTKKPNGYQFGFSVADGRIRCHVDGIINGAPEALGLTFPMLWECKSLNTKSWKDTVKRGIAKSKPVYATQMATYQAYMEGNVPGTRKKPALFTAIMSSLGIDLMLFSGYRD